jgi:hypothetical protein
MTGTLLDSITLPANQTYVCKDGTRIDMCQFLGKFHDTLQTLTADGMIRANASFGFAMAEPCPGDTGFDDILHGWDNPDKFVWFVGGWGPDKDRYIANAVRKMRAALRVGSSTLDIRHFMPEEFEDKVDSTNADDTIPWGDFAWGGAGFVQVFDLMLIGGVSGFHEIEDDTVLRLILGSLGKIIAIGDDLIPAG